MDQMMLARLGAVVFIAIALTATAIEMTRKGGDPDRAPSTPAKAAESDPLHDELVRCQLTGEAGPRDAACLQAWAENRKRFLGAR